MGSDLQMDVRFWRVWYDDLSSSFRSLLKVELAEEMSKDGWIRWALRVQWSLEPKL